MAIPCKNHTVISHTFFIEQARVTLRTRIQGPKVEDFVVSGMYHIRMNGQNSTVGTTGFERDSSVNLIKKYGTGWTGTKPVCLTEEQQ